MLPKARKRLRVARVFVDSHLLFVFGIACVRVCRGPNMHERQRGVNVDSLLQPRLLNFRLGGSPYERVRLSFSQ